MAHRAADAARLEVAPRFRAPIEVEAKADATPVTVADRAAEQAMRRLIEEACPTHGIQGEEFGFARPEAEWIWHLDPIDGTKSFVTGTPMFGTLIGLRRGDNAVLGLMDQPVLRERWLAHGEAPTCFNGKPIRTRRCTALAEAVLFTSGANYMDPESRPGFERLSAATRFTRGSGDCYAYGLLAMGFVDVVVDGTMHPHDYAALIPIVENAGGAISGWRGEPLPFDHPSAVLAVGDPALQGRVIETLQAGTPGRP